MSSARSDSGEPPGTATSPDNVSESRKDIKGDLVKSAGIFLLYFLTGGKMAVKVFYTFQGSDTTCLCSFTIGLNFESSAQYVQVPLKDCLMALCASWYSTGGRVCIRIISDDGIAQTCSYIPTQTVLSTVPTFKKDHLEKTKSSGKAMAFFPGFWTATMESVSVAS